MASSNLKYTLRANQSLKLARQAEEILDAAGLLSLPVDPLKLAETESHLLKVDSGDFGDSFDGLLEYHERQGQFLLFYNNRYETGGNVLHPRTRFSVAHELGHFYLDRHRDFLQRGGESHFSTSEFLVDDEIEREADDFAAGLLMPDSLFRPLVNQNPLSIERLIDIRDLCRTSLVSTAIRSVVCSDFPSYLIAIKDGRIAWRFCSNSLIEGHCYPLGSDDGIRSGNARRQWDEFSKGVNSQESCEGKCTDWFWRHGDGLDSIYVDEYYVPITIMGMLLVLVIVDEQDLFSTGAY